MKVLGMTLGFLLAMLVMFGLGYEYSQYKHNQPYVTPVSEGIYRVIDIKKGFDPYTTEPVYWIIGGKMSSSDLVINGKSYGAINVEPSHISVYSIPRKMVKNLLNDDSRPDPSSLDWRLDVKDGEALLLK